MEFASQTSRLVPSAIFSFLPQRESEKRHLVLVLALEEDEHVAIRVVEEGCTEKRPQASDSGVKLASFNSSEEHAHVDSEYLHFLLL